MIIAGSNTIAREIECHLWKWARPPMGQDIRLGSHADGSFLRSNASSKLEMEKIDDQ